MSDHPRPTDPAIGDPYPVLRAQIDGLKERLLEARAQADPATSDQEPVRQYLVVIQDERGYPVPGELDPCRGDLDPAPLGPKPAVVHAAVLAEDFKRVKRERDALERERDEARDRAALLQRVVDRAYDNAMEFGDDAATALAIVSETLEPHVTPGESEASGEEGDRG